MDHLPGYTTLRQIGSGQFGDVFLVRRLHDRALFAAKWSRSEAVAAMQREAQLLQSMRHPNVVQCVEVVALSPTEIVIVMEYASRGDLASYLRDAQESGRSLPEAEIMRIFIQIALVLVYLHSRHVLHRDLKPQNILLDADGIVKVSDFGVSRTLNHTLDVAETIAGTPYYMSPELMDNHPYNAKSDVWSLGCLLYELATFAPPFKGKALATLVLQIVRDNPLPLPATYTVDLDGLVKKLLDKSPDRRPDIKQVLTLPFVQEHLCQLASTAPIRPVQTQIPALFDPVGGDTITPLEYQHIPQAPILRCPMVVPYSSVTSNPVDCHLLAAPRASENPHNIADTNIARQVFFENQAAARRNKDRVVKEKMAPAIFLDPDLSNKPALPDHLQQPPVRISLPQKDHEQQVLDQARQCFLDNLRVAKLNKQRALDDLEKDRSLADASTIPQPSPPVAGMLSPPPPPIPSHNPRTQRSPPSSSRKDQSAFEDLLHEERKRVRVEHRLLLERMRALQHNPDPVMQGGKKNAGIR